MYLFHKLSAPGYTLSTDSLQHVYAQLHAGVCAACHEDKDLPEDFAQLPLRERVDALLGTSCGCEYWLEEVESVQLDFEALMPMGAEQLQDLAARAIGWDESTPLRPLVSNEDLWVLLHRSGLRVDFSVGDIFVGEKLAHSGDVQSLPQRIVLVAAALGRRLLLGGKESK